MFSWGLWYYFIPSTSFWLEIWTCIHSPFQWHSLICRCAFEFDKGFKAIKDLDGLIGLGYSDVTIPAQLSKKGITRDISGHCLQMGPYMIDITHEYNDDTEPVGYVFFGDDPIPRHSVIWTPIQSIKKYLKIHWLNSLSSS